MIIPILSSLILLPQCDVTAQMDSERSSYQIVLPTKVEDQALDGFLKKTAELLRDCLMNVTGKTPAIVREGKNSSDQIGIFLGDTQAGRNAKLDLSQFKPWEYVIENTPNGIILAGRDFKVRTDARRHARYALGTVKAATSFLEQFCGTRFCLPGPLGIIVGEQSGLTIPPNLKIRKTPRFSYCSGRPKGMFYDVANNFFPAIDYGSYGGHSHDKAIPPERFFKTHPEYFALINGKRVSSLTHPQYCISNKNVRELIYRELLRKLDEGYSRVQLGQSDGFKPCECAKCEELHSVNDFGEKLWITHRNMATRLLKDRPGKEVVILAYGPTREPPKTFDTFPENVAVEICRYDENFLRKWSGVNVPKGLFTYIYNWGDYQWEGFTPKLPPAALKEQIERFGRYGVQGIYRCGFGELFGLEGPNYYLYGKLLDNPELDCEKILDDYCHWAFGVAAVPMRKFFDLLNQRLALTLKNKRQVDWNDSDLLEGKLPHSKKNIRILTLRYPTRVIDKLEGHLSEAEKKAEAPATAARIELTRKEFNYLKWTAKTAGIFEQYLAQPSSALFNELTHALDERKRVVKVLPVSYTGKIQPFEGVPLFGGIGKSDLLKGGRMHAEFKAPFYWDVSLIHNLNIAPGARTTHASFSLEPIKIDGKANEAVWQRAEPETLLRLYMDKRVGFVKTTVRVAYDQNAFYALFQFPEDNAHNLSKNVFMMFLESDKKEDQLLRFSFHPFKRHIMTAKRYPARKKDYRSIYKPIVIKEQVVSKFTVDQETGMVTGELRVPFSVYSVKPKAGDTWYGNFMRRIPDNTPFTDFIWEPNINWRTWRDRYDAMGEIIFDKYARAGRGERPSQTPLVGARRGDGARWLAPPKKNNQQPTTTHQGKRQ